MIKIFRHYISRAFLGLLLGEFLVFFLAMYFGSQLRFLYEPSWYSERDILLASIIFALILSVANTSLGLYRKSLSIIEYDLLARVSFSFGLALFMATTIYYLLPQFLVARSVLGAAIFLAFLAMMLSRYFFYRYAKSERLKQQVLVIGAGRKAARLADLNTDYLHKGFTIVGFVALPNETLHVEQGRVIDLDHQQTILNIAKKHDVDEIVLALDDRRRHMPLDDLLDCKMSGFPVMDLVSFYEREQSLIPLSEIYPSWFLYSDGFALSGLRTVVKRMIDIFSSLLLLLLTWPIMLLTALAIKLEDGWHQPVMFRQVRVGEHNREFEVIKFRSMIVDAEKNGAQFAKVGDPRVTRVGRFIRLARIDELPQIFNVLKGEMSFVGPRPERPEFVKGFRQRIEYYAERHRVKPGITGWAQTSYPYGANEEDTRRKLEYDLYYVKNYSVFLDLTIILQTIETVLWGKGAR